MYFASDNSGPVPQQVLDALAEANTGYAMGYGADALTRQVQNQICDAFEAPGAAVHLVATGTAANVLALSAYTAPWQTVFCTPLSHISCDECNAPEFFSGAKLTLVGSGAHMSADELRAAIEEQGVRGVHGAQRGPVSISQVSEAGVVYSLDEVQALANVAKDYGLPVHMDGARFANALMALGCTPAELSWKSGIDVLSFGGTKNGLMGVEAVVFFDPDRAWEFELRRKRGAHLFSKHRYLSAQMAAYMRDDLWLTLAKQANANCARLATGLRAKGVQLMNDARANMLFARLPRDTHQHLHAAGAVYHLGEGLSLDGTNGTELLNCRMVCDWSLPETEIDRFLALLD